MSYNFKIDIEREIDGRWIAAITALPGVIVYGKTRADAVRAVYVLALRVLADRMERTEKAPATELRVSLPLMPVDSLAQDESKKGMIKSLV